MPSSQPADPVDPFDLPGETGPNGRAIVYSDEGDKLEEAGDASNEEPLLLLRGEFALADAMAELHGLVQLKRKLDRMAGDPTYEDSEPYFNASRLATARGEFGIDLEHLDEFEWGLLCGRMSALRWVFGDTWEDSLSTAIACDPGSTTGYARTAAEGA